MSKYKEIRTEIKSQAHICRALTELGLPFEVAPAGEPLTLMGYQGDARPETADVVVRRTHLDHASNDAGWVYDAQSGTYVQVFSEFDLRLAKTRQIAQQVKQKCALYGLEEIAEANGYALNVVEEHGVQRVFVGGAW